MKLPACERGSEQQRGDAEIDSTKDTRITHLCSTRPTGGRSWAGVCVCSVPAVLQPVLAIEWLT
jgi:hypothetical protein